MLSKRHQKSISFTSNAFYESSPEVRSETDIFPVLRLFFTKPFRFPVQVKPTRYSPVEFQLNASNGIGNVISESETVKITQLEVQVSIILGR